MKFDVNGVRQWGTFYGDTLGDRIRAVHSVGNSVYVAGYSNSDKNIATPGAFQDSLDGDYDAFLVKFDDNGTRQWGTYFGGDARDECWDISVDNSGVFMGGWTRSLSHITTPGSFQPVYAGHTGNYDAGDCFIAHFDPNGQRTWATYYGEYENEAVRGIVHDGQNIYISGVTGSQYGMGSPGSHQPIYGYGGWDAFMARIGPCDHDSATVNLVACDSLVSPSGLQVWTSTGTYHDTVYTTLGCDSFLTLNVVIIPSSQITHDTIEICTRDSIYLMGRGVYVRKQGTYFDTLTNVLNCDSVIQIELFTNGDSVYFPVTTCGPYLHPGHTNSWNTTGLYIDSLIDQNGCDSLVYIDLIVNYDDSTVVYDTACGSYLSPTAKYIWTSSGIYRDTIPTQKGCDSILIFHLVIQPGATVQPGWKVYRCNAGPITFVDSTIAANIVWYTKPFGGIPVFTGNTFTTPHLLQSRTYYAQAATSLCTSARVPVEAVVLFGDSMEYDTTVCVSYTAPGNNLLTTTGIHRIIFQNSVGCDSILKVDLTVIPVDKHITIDGNMLVSNADSVIYQWVECPAYTPITGENSKSFVPINKGNYAVIVNQNGCTDTSDCIDMNWLGVFGLNQTEPKVYPIPTSDILNIELGSVSFKIIIKLYNELGQIAAIQKVLESDRISLDMKGLSTGFYHLSIETDDVIFNKVVMKH